MAIRMKPAVSGKLKKPINKPGAKGTEPIAASDVTFLSSEVIDIDFEAKPHSLDLDKRHHDVTVKGKKTK